MMPQFQACSNFNIIFMKSLGLLLSRARVKATVFFSSQGKNTVKIACTTELILLECWAGPDSKLLQVVTHFSLISSFDEFIRLVVGVVFQVCKEVVGVVIQD